jgi:hypothetical protein
MKSSRSLFRAPSSLGSCPLLLVLCTDLALSGLCEPQVEFESFADGTTPWYTWDEIPVVTGTLLPGSKFEESLVLQFDGDGIQDIAALWNEDVYLLLDPGRGRSSTLVASGVRDVTAIWPAGCTDDDLVTAGIGGVKIHGFHDGAVEPPHTVVGNWQLAGRVEGYRLSSGTVTWTVLAIWDEIGGGLYVTLVRPQGNGYEQVDLGSFQVGGDVTALAIANLCGNGLPEILVGKQTGLRVHDIFGAVVRSYSGETEGLVACGTVGDHERMAWVRNVSNTGGQYRALKVLGATLEDDDEDVQWSSSKVQSMGFQALDGQSALVTGASDGAVRIFTADSPSHPFSPPVSPQGVQTAATPSCPLVAEFNCSEWTTKPDLVLFYDELADAQIFHGKEAGQEVATPDPTIKVSIQHINFYFQNYEYPPFSSCIGPIPDSPVVNIEAELPLHTPGILDEVVRINVYTWNAVPTGLWEPLAFVEQSLDSDPDKECIDLSFDFGVPPEGLVFEVIVRGLVNGRLTASETAYYALVDVSQGGQLPPIPNFSSYYSSCTTCAGVRGVDPIPGGHRCTPGTCP